MTFYQWLLTQLERNDLIGDFAYTVSQVGDEPEMSGQKRSKNAHKIWADWLLKHNASRDVLAAFNAAWEAYIQAHPDAEPLADTENDNDNDDDIEDDA